MAKKKITALVPYFGSNRTLAENVGSLLDGLPLVAIPFAGSMCECLHIGASTLLINDKNEHVVNLAHIVSHPKHGSQLIRRLRRTAFCHPERLKDAQQYCKEKDRVPACDIEACVDWAESYFIASWVGRNGHAGTKKEFDTKVSIRYDSGGGDSAIRVRSAVEALRDWHKVLVRGSFTTLDYRDFLKKVKDDRKHGIYADPPFPVVGDDYKHQLGTGTVEQQHGELAAALSAYKEARIVIRYYDVPLVRSLYKPDDGWRYHELCGRKQTNAIGPELLIVRNGL